MQRRAPLLSLAIGCVAAACQQPEPRVSRVLGSVGGLVISNSPAVVSPQMPESSSKGLVVPYTLLVHHAGEAPVSIGIGHGAFVVEDLQVPATCRVGGETGGALWVHRGERWRLDCRAVLAPEQMGPITNQDVEGAFVLPVRTESGEAELQLTYRLLAEDTP